MRLFSVISIAGAVVAAGLSSAGAQYYYPPQPGYYQQPYQQPYYPQQRQNPQYQQQPRQQQRPQQQQQSTPKQQSAPQRKNPPKDMSRGTPPDADVSTIAGPFIAYTWDFTDTLGDLGKAAGISADQVLKLNDLSLSQLRDGQVLKIPQTSNTASLDIKMDAQTQLSREVWRGIRGKKRIALTFDAGGDPDGYDLLLENLKQANASATFFVTGKFAEDHPEIMQQIVEGGFPVHNHSWSHPDFTTISNDEIATELQRTDEVVEKATGLSTKPYWRPPFGDRDTRVKNAAGSEGYQSIYWTLDSLDSVGDPKSAAFVTDRVLNPPNATANPDGFLDGAIVLMHVGMPETAKAIPAIVARLRERDFTLVTVDEILQP